MNRSGLGYPSARPAWEASSFSLPLYAKVRRRISGWSKNCNYSCFYNNYGIAIARCAADRNVLWQISGKFPVDKPQQSQWFLLPMDPIVSDAERGDLNEEDDAVYLDTHRDEFKNAFRNARKVNNYIASHEMKVVVAHAARLQTSIALGLIIPCMVFLWIRKKVENSVSISLGIATPFGAHSLATATAIRFTYKKCNFITLTKPAPLEGKRGVGSTIRFT